VKIPEVLTVLINFGRNMQLAFDPPPDAVLIVTHSQRIQPRISIVLYDFKLVLLVKRGN